MSRYTITDLARICGYPPEQHPDAHRSLRKAAQLGALGPGERVDAKGTQAFGPEGLFRGALLLAMRRFNLHPEGAAHEVECAHVVTPLADVIAAVGRGEGWRLRILANQSPQWLETRFQRYDAEPLFGREPSTVAGILIIDLPTIWAPCFASLEAQQ